MIAKWWIPYCSCDLFKYAWTGTFHYQHSCFENLVFRKLLSFLQMSSHRCSNIFRKMFSHFAMISTCYLSFSHIDFFFVQQTAGGFRRPHVTGQDGQETSSGLHRTTVDCHMRMAAASKSTPKQCIKQASGFTWATHGHPAVATMIPAPKPRHIFRSTVAHDRTCPAPKSKRGTMPCATSPMQLQHVFEFEHALDAVHVLTSSLYCSSLQQD